MIDISYELSEADAIEGAPPLKLSSKFAIALCLVVVIAGYLFFFQQKVFAAALVLYSIGLVFLAKRRRRANIKKQFRGAPFLHGEIRARISEAGIEMTYPTGASTTRWDGYQSCRETEHLILLLLSPAFFRAFPKRAFTPDQLIEFRRLLQEHKLTPNA